jgi:alcohol dehydrogenase (NADP+)
MDRSTRTYGGYSERIVVPEAFVLHISPSLDLAAAAPLLCAGITTYSPLRHWNTRPGDKVGVVGLGGLGHMAVKLAAAMGAEVTMLSTSPGKEGDARRLGAAGFGLTSDPATFKRLAGRFDLIIDTISAPHDYNQYLGMVRTEGAMVLLGVPPAPTPIAATSLIFGRKTLSGSLIGGIKETQEMLDFCAEHKVVSDIELIPFKDINGAYARMLKGDVRYRFVLDLKTL